LCACSIIRALADEAASAESATGSIDSKAISHPP
jgi:hypothetical protein